MNRVFLFEPTTRHNVSGAAEHGEIHTLCEAPFSPFASDVILVTVARRLREVNFDPTSDSIVLTGNPPVVAMGLAAALCVFEGVNVLVFDARNSKYCKRVVQDPTLTEGEVNATSA